MRGQLTDTVQAVARRHLGRELKSTAELRLLPYLDYQMKNEQRLDPNKLNQEDRTLLSGLRAKGHIAGGASGLSMTKDFYDAVQEILWQAYVVQGSVTYQMTHSD